MTLTTRTPSGRALERSAEHATEARAAERSPAERRGPSRRMLALAAAVTVLVAAPVALIAGAPDDETPASSTAAASASPADAGPAERRAAAAPAQLPPLLFASDRAPREAAGDGTASDGAGADRAPGYRLYAAEPDGGGVVEVVDGLAMFPAWSHDGTRIAYVGEAAGFTARRAALAVVEADGALRDVVAGPQVPSRPAFRERDDELWFQSSLQGSNGAAGVSEHATIDAVGLRNGRPRTMLDRGGAIYQPAWSPDGTRLAVVLGDPACREGRRCRQTLAVSDPAVARGSAGDDARLGRYGPRPARLGRCICGRRLGRHDPRHARRGRPETAHARRHRCAGDAGVVAGRGADRVHVGSRRGAADLGRDGRRRQRATGDERRAAGRRADLGARRRVARLLARLRDLRAADRRADRDRRHPHARLRDLAGLAPGGETVTALDRARAHAGARPERSR